MSSKIRQRKRLRQPLSHTDVDGDDDASDTESMSVGGGGEGPALRKRQASVYDAVAGSYTIPIVID